MIIMILILVRQEAALAIGTVLTEEEGAVDRISEAHTFPLVVVALGPFVTLKTLSKMILDEVITPEVAVASSRTGNLTGGSTTCNLSKIAINEATSESHTLMTTTPGVVSGRDSLVVRVVAHPTTTLKTREGSSIIGTVGTLKYLSASSRTLRSPISRSIRRLLKMRST
jgi:hypothetical protein